MLKFLIFLLIAAIIKNLRRVALFVLRTIKNTYLRKAMMATTCFI